MREIRISSELSYKRLPYLHFQFSRKFKIYFRLWLRTYACLLLCPVCHDEYYSPCPVCHDECYSPCVMTGVTPRVPCVLLDSLVSRHSATALPVSTLYAFIQLVSSLRAGSPARTRCGDVRRGWCAGPVPGVSRGWRTSWGHPAQTCSTGTTSWTRSAGVTSSREITSSLSRSGDKSFPG